MAVAAIEKTGSWSGSQTTYIFVVDTTTGAHVGKAVKFYHGANNWKMYVVNQGLLMSQGQVYVAFFSDFNPGWGNSGWTGGLCSSAKRDSRPRIGAYDWTNDAVKFYLEGKEYGKSAALLLTDTNPDPMWLAGVTTKTESSPPVWMFCLFNMKQSDGTVT